MFSIHSHFKRHRATCVLLVCLMSTVGWMSAAHADSSTAAPQTVASKSIVAKPGESDEVRAKHAKKHSNPIKNKRDYTKDDTLSDTLSNATPAPDDNNIKANYISAPAQKPMNALILYDAPPDTQYEKLGLAYSIMLKNLLGHFDGSVVQMPVQDYVSGQTESYATIFYVGSNYDSPVPASFLQDVSTTSKTVLWFHYNIWQLASDPAYNFSANFGLNFAGLKGMNAAPTNAQPAPGFFDTVLYKNKSFVKYYKYDNNTGVINADPDIGVMTIADSIKASSLVNIKNSATNEQVPYLVRAKNFWYFADMPLSYIGPRDRYLVLADVLHDILGIDHPENHQAMIRLEDVDARVSVANMKNLTDYLYKQKIPFSVATIAYYKDPLGTYTTVFH